MKLSKKNSQITRENKRFKKIEAKSKYSQIIEQILDLIKRGVYKSGDQLPNERMLSKEIGVSRGALREALKALIVLGIIESRQGDGTYICNTSPVRDRAYLFLEDASIEEIIRVREVIDLGCAGLGINNVTRQDLMRLDKQIEKMRICKNLNNHEGYLQASRNFHLIFADIFIKEGENSVRNVVNYLWNATNLALSKEIYEDYRNNRIEEYLNIHGQIIEGIKNKSFQNIQKAIKRHYQFIKDQLFLKS